MKRIFKLTGSKDGKGKSNGPILKGDKVETTIDQPCPDEDVGNDSSTNVSGVDSNGTNPVQRNKVESKRAGKNGNVVHTVALGEAEIAKGQVEEVDNDQKQRPPEVAAGPEVHKAETEKVAEGVGGSQVDGSVDRVDRAEEVEVVDNLEEEEDDPVNRADNWVQREGSVVTSILSPDAVGMAVVLVRSVERVVPAGNECEEE